MPSPKPSEKLLKTIRDYATEEPGFTCAFAAWDLTTNRGYPISANAVKTAVAVLLTRGVVKLVEDHGRAGKVYVYHPPPPAVNVPRLELRDLDESLTKGVGSEAPTRGVAVPHTRYEGPSGRPGRDRKRQDRGVRVKRARQGT